MASSNIEPEKKQPEMWDLFSKQLSQGKSFLGNEQNLLQQQYGNENFVPKGYIPDTTKQNQDIYNQNLINKYQGDKLESQIDPYSYKIRSGLSKTISDLTSPERIQQNQNNWLKTVGAPQVYGSGAKGTIAASGLYDAGTAEGQNNLLKLADIQKNYIGDRQNIGLDPSSRVSETEQANLANQQNNQNYLNSALTAGAQYNQSASDFTNNSINAAMNLANQEAGIWRHEAQTAADSQNASNQAIMKTIGNTAIAAASIAGAAFTGGTTLALGTGLITALNKFLPKQPQPAQ